MTTVEWTARTVDGHARVTTERLNKVIARAGIASRRAADRLIEEGRVTVNGREVRELGLRIDTHSDAVKVDGKRIPAPSATPTWILMHKPKGYVTTLSDPEGRPTVRDLLRGVRGRVWPVGRLDYATEGLLLLTDDGELARQLRHPSGKVPKTYHGKGHGRPDAATIERLAAGPRVAGRKALPARVRLLRTGRNAWVEIEVVEGRKHQVRNMLRAVGHPVQKLRRVAFAGLALGDLPAGAWRLLSPLEVRRLRGAVSPAGTDPAPRRRQAVAKGANRRN